MLFIIPPFFVVENFRYAALPGSQYLHHDGGAATLGSRWMSEQTVFEPHLLGGQTLKRPSSL